MGTQTSTRLRAHVLVAVLAALAMIFVAPTAQASTVQANTVQSSSVSTVMTTSGAIVTGVESCAGVIAAIGGGVPGWAAAAIAAPFCGQWLGDAKAAEICWGSRQWWGWSYRAFVFAATWGYYSRC